MKFARCAREGDIFWALVEEDGSTIRRLADGFGVWAPRITAGGGRDILRFHDQPLDLSDVRLLPPVEKTNKIVVAGANYVKHLAELGIAPPSRPFAFLKAYGALIGAHDPIEYPPLTGMLDYEVELVAIVGSDRLDRQEPLAGVLGYCVGNDVSARDIQNAGPPGIGMDLFGAKSQDRTTGLGPWIVTKDEFPPGSPRLRLTLTVNGEVRQDGTSADMSWDVGALLSFVDGHSRLECGDILFTGTPTGIAQASGRFLQPGDLVEADIEGIGTLRNRVILSSKRSAP